MMDIVTEDEKRASGPVMPSQWSACAAKPSCLAAKPIDGKYTEERRLSLSQLKAAPSYNTGFYTQLKLLMHRTIKQHRGERLTRTAVLLQLMYLFFTALFWWRIPDNTARVFERNSLLFFMLIAQANGIVIARDGLSARTCALVP
jgi:hypothetical protein